MAGRVAWVARGSTGRDVGAFSCTDWLSAKVGGASADAVGIGM